MQENTKKYSLGVAVIVLILGFVAVIISTTGKNKVELEPEDNMMGSAEETVDDVGEPPQLIVDPEVSLSGALTPDGNFYKYERNSSVPSSSRLDASTPRENWVALVSDEEYNDIAEFLDENTDLTDQLTLAVVWDAREQEWEVYPNEIFRSNYDIKTLDIFSDDFDGVVLFNASRSFRYADHTEERVGDFDVRKGWNYGPKPNFNDIKGQVVTFWEGDVTGNAKRLTSRSDLNKAIDKDFFDDLDNEDTYWFYVKGAAEDTCSDTEALVCGKDGNTYRNSCKAEAENVDVDYDGACKNDRTALRGRIKDNSLKANETLVLEFFTSTSDTTPETIQISDSEVDLDDNDTDLAIYKKNGSAREFITAFSSSNVDAKTKAIEIDLDDKLSAGEYELRIFDTFDKEKVREDELDFTVEAAQVTEVDYTIESVTPRTMVLKPSSVVGEIDLSEIRNSVALYNSDGSNKVNGGGTVSLDSNKKITLSFTTDTFVLDAPVYKLKIAETEKTDESWKVKSYEKDLKPLKMELASGLSRSVQPGGLDRFGIQAKFTNGSTAVAEDFATELNWVDIYDKDANTVITSTKTDQTGFNASVGGNGGHYVIGFVFDSNKSSFQIKVSSLSYFDAQGYYVPAQSADFVYERG